MISKDITKKWLEQQYLVLKKNPSQIAKEFELSFSTIWRHLKKFGIPTRSYSESFLLIRKNGKDSPLYKHGKKSIICSFCGKRKSSRTGSERCWDCYVKTIYGKGNNNYKGLADITSIVRQYSKIQWRPKILERDNFVCQCCGKMKNLDVHHIIPLSTIIEEFCKGKILTSIESRLEICKQIINLPQINDANNGKTLCKECHKKEHKGIDNFTKI